MSGRCTSSVAVSRSRVEVTAHSRDATRRDATRRKDEALAAAVRFFISRHYSSQTSFPFLSFVHLHFLSPEELTHFFFWLVSAIRMPATVAPDAPPMIARVLPEIE